MLQAHTFSPGIRHQLQNLRIFLFVANARSIKGASEHLFKAPSAITRSIIELEKAVGVPLFERKPRGMMINAYGEALLNRVLRIQDEIEQAAEEILRTKAKIARSSIGAVTGMLFSDRKLELLIHLADLRNMSSTATQMGMTQSGASMALCRIEAVLGQPLFHRRMEGMVATEAAERLVLRARRVFAELRHISSDISVLSGSLSGTVVIGTTPLGRADFLPTAIATTIAQHPGLRVSTVESLYDALIGDLRSGDVDMVFGVLRPPELCQGLISEPLFTDRLSVVARADHSLSKRVNLEIADLIDERWILPRPVALARPVVEAAFRKLGLDPPVPAVESGDLSIVRQLLCTSDMLAVTSPNQLALELRTGTLVELPVTLGGTDRDVGLILREGAMLSPASLTVLEAVRRQSRLQNQRRLLAAS